jgi:hypothetical protein
MIAGAEPDDMVASFRGAVRRALAESAIIARMNISAKNPQVSIANCRASCYGIVVTQGYGGTPC